MGKIRTVLGDIFPEKFGLALVHEHIICDFIGADNVSRERYDPQEVFVLMFPYLKEIRQLGVTGFVDCTPAYMARDGRLLAKLSEASNIHIITNTGLYKEPYLPKYAFECTANELCDMWIREIRKGIDGTSIKAGFIKIAVNPGQIVPIQQKIVRAACRCSLSTGAVIACHTASGVAAMQLLEILKEEGVNADRLIVVHCDAEQEIEYHRKIADQGAWVEYDGIRKETSERTLMLIQFMLKNNFEEQLLLSQDAGWYNVGEKEGGNICGYGYLIEDFIPLMLKRGFNKKFANEILVKNPARAFQIK